MRPASRWQVTVAVYLAGQTVSLFGSAVVSYSMIWWVALETGNAITFALLSLVAVLPQGLVALPAGVWADRYSRKLLVIGADAAIAVVTLALAVAFWLDAASMVVLGAALLLRSIGGGIQTPAETAILPQLTPANQLLRVNAINSTIQSVCMLVAPALAAVLLVAWKDVHWILLLDVITAIIAIAILAPIPIPKPPGAEAERRHIWREMAEGGRAVAASPVLRRTFWLDGAVWTLIMPAAMLAPIVVTKLWGGEEWMLAGVEIAYSGAFILGAAFLAAWGGLRNRMKLMLVGALMWGAFTLAQALSPGVWVYIILWGAFGLVGPWLTTTGVTVLQENCPPDLLGRVMGLNTMVGLLAGPVGMMVIAPFMDLPNPPVRLVLAITGVLAMAATALAAIKAPSAIRPDPAPPPAAPELSPEPS